MGAALHLAQVHQVPPGPKRKRKGGGGRGGEFYKYATRIYNDDRADGPARELLLAVAYAVATAPAGDGKAQWALVRKALGPSRSYRSRIEDLVGRDIPQYVPPDRQIGGHTERARRCQAPRLRPYRERHDPRRQYTGEQRIAQQKREAEDFRNVENICGDLGNERVVEKALDTGWHQYRYFCPRHHDHLLRVQEQVREQNERAPEPIPNVGGLLPSYFDADWEVRYRKYAPRLWEPPVYGLRADDWPVPGKDPVPPRARLRLVIGGLGIDDEQET
ncbi:hypothetical protein ABZ404_36995 [Streptomyces sp. NPDC005878]|uniref:hypothetical protein n=1 Tax=Streptomyces sp. NPDC005878 TaxID=3157077 RepID=UPI0033E8EACA